MTVSVTLRSRPVSSKDRSVRWVPTAHEVGPITRAFIGPQFVKSASESEVALSRELLLSVDDVSKTFTQRRGTR